MFKLYSMPVFSRYRCACTNPNYLYDLRKYYPKVEAVIANVAGVLENMFTIQVPIFIFLVMAAMILTLRRLRVPKTQESISNSHFV